MGNFSFTKQFIEFQRSSLNSGMKAMSAFQEPMFRMSKMFFESGTQIPQESKAMMDEWMKAFKNYQTDLQKTIDSSYGLFETFFTEAEQGDKATKK